MALRTSRSSRAMRKMRSTRSRIGLKPRLMPSPPVAIWQAEGRVGAWQAEGRVGAEGRVTGRGQGGRPRAGWVQPYDRKVCSQGT